MFDSLSLGRRWDQLPPLQHETPSLVGATSAATGPQSGQIEETVLSIEELARQFNVSTKTISRWRRQGLVCRRFVVDGRRRIGFLRSSVDRFVALNPLRVERGARFSRLDADERVQIIEDARRLAAGGISCAEATKRLARSTGRSTETIRSILKRYDREQPEKAVFHVRGGPMGSELRHELYQLHKRGEAVEDLARRFGRTVASVQRVVNRVRLQRIRELPLSYIANAQFDGIGAAGEAEILGPGPTESETAAPKPPGGLPSYVASLYDVPLLTPEQETHLFRKMNYLKYKASRLREQLDPARPRKALMDRIEKLYGESVATKNAIVSANLRLVVSIAKRHASPGIEFFELVSDGNVSLIRAVDKFDFALGNRFSTYASWAIMKNFSRTIPDAHRHGSRFHTGADKLFETTEDMRSNATQLEDSQSQRLSAVTQILGHLDQREREIVIRRFGLLRGEEPRTLKEVGAVMGVTKERIRQIETRALGKLHAAAVEARLEAVDY